MTTEQQNNALPGDGPLKGTPLASTTKLTWHRERMLLFTEPVFVTIDARAIGTTYLRLDVGAEGMLLVDDWAEQIEALSGSERRLLAELASDQGLRGLVMQQIGGAAYRNHQPAKPVMAITRLFLIVTGVLSTTKSVRSMVKRLGLKGVSRRVIYCLTVAWLLFLNVYRNLLRTGEHILITREHPSHELGLADLVGGYLKNALSEAVATKARMVANGTGFLQLSAFSDDAGVFFRSLFSAITNVLDKRPDVLRYISLLRFCLKADRMPKYLKADPVLNYIRHDLAFISIALDDANAKYLPTPPLKPSLELQFTHNALLELFRLPGVYIDRIAFSQYLGLNHRLVKSESARHMGINQGIFLTKATGSVDPACPTFSAVTADGQIQPELHDGATVIMSDLRDALVKVYGFDANVKGWQDQTPKSPVIQIRNRLSKQAFLTLALGLGADITVLSQNQDLRGYAIQSSAVVAMILSSPTSLEVSLRTDRQGLLHDGADLVETRAVTRVLCGRQETGSHFNCPNLATAFILGLSPGAGSPLRPADVSPSEVINRDTLIQPGTLTVTDIERPCVLNVELPYSATNNTVRLVDIKAPVARLIGRSLGLGGTSNSQFILRRFAVYESLETGLMLEAMRLADLSSKEGGVNLALQDQALREKIVAKLTPPVIVGMAHEALQLMADAKLTPLFAETHEGSLLLGVCMALAASILKSVEGQDPWLVNHGITRFEYLSNALIAIGVSRRALEAI